MLETEDGAREKPPKPREWEPSFLVTDTRTTDRTPVAEPRDTEKTLYEPKVSDDGRQVTTFDGRIFSESDPSKDEWQVECDCKKVTVENLRLHPDKTLTYTLNGSTVTELPNGEKLVTENRQTTRYDRHGKEITEKGKSPREFLDTLKSKVKPDAAPSAAGAMDGVEPAIPGGARSARPAGRDAVPATVPPAVPPTGDGADVPAPGSDGTHGREARAIARAAEAPGARDVALSPVARNPELFSTNPLAVESKTFKSAATLLPEVVAGIKDNGRPEDVPTRDYFRATTPEERRRALTELHAMARDSDDPMVRRRALDMQLIDRTLLAKSASNILEKAEANGAEGEKQTARRDLTEALKEIAKFTLPATLSPEGIGKPGNPHHYSQEAASRVLLDFRAKGRDAEVNAAIAQAQNETAALPGQSFAEMHRFVSDQPTAKQRMEARETSVKELDALNKRSGRDELGETLRSLKPLKAMLDIKDTSDPALALSRLTTLRELDEGGNQDAKKYLDYLGKKLGGPEKLAELETALARGGKDAEKALDDLKTKALNADDSPAQSKLNELKTEDITRGLTLRSSETDLKAAKEKLDREVRAGNKEAADSARLLEVAARLKQLEDPERAPQAMRDLIEMSKPDGEKPANPYAREALATMLLSGNNKGIEAFRGILNKDGDQHKRVLIPDLSRHKPEQVDELKTDAVKALRESVKSGQPLTTHEATALGLALADVVKRSNVEHPLAKEIRGTFEDIFSRKIDKDKGSEVTAARRDTTAALAGLFRSITGSGETGSKASGILVHEYLRGASSEHNQRLTGGDIGKEFKDHVQTFKDLALRGNPEALSVLAGFTAGAGRHNHLAGFNDELARSARDTMVKIATDQPQLRDSVIDALTKFPQPLLADESRRRETLGLVAALGPNEVPDLVRDELHKGLGLTGPARESAINGMIALAPKMNHDDIKALTDNLTPELRTALERNKDKFSPVIGKHLTTAMADVALDRKRPAEERIRALEVVAAIGPKHITPETITALRRLGSESGRRNLSQDYEIASHDASEKKAVAETIGRIQRGAADALLSVAEHATEPATKMHAFMTFANTDWGLTQSPDRAHWVHRLNKLQDDNPDNVIIHAVAPRVMHRLNLDERPHPPQSTEAARLAAKFFHQGASDISDKALLELTRGAIEKYGAKKVDAVVDRLTLFNSLPPEIRRELTKFEGTLGDRQTLSLEGRTVDPKTFNALPEEVRKQLFGTAEKLREPERLNLEGKRISAATFNALPAHVRQYINGSGVMGKNTEVPLDALKGKSLDAVTFNSLSDASRRALNGSSRYLAEGYSVPDLAGKVIPNADFNKLSPELRRSLTGSDAEMPPGERLSFTGRSVDAEVYNKLPPDLRARLSGSEKEMAPGTKLTVEQLKGKELTAEQFNSLAPELRRQLTGTADERKKSDPPLSMSGKTIDAKTFNQLPLDIRDQIAGTIELMPDGRIIKDLSSESIDAKSFNALPAELRGRLSATEKPLDATTVLALMRNGTISESDSIARALGSPSFDDQVWKMEKDAKTKLESAQLDLAKLEKFKTKAIEHLSKHAEEEGIGWYRKLASQIGLSDAQRRFIDRQEGHLFSIASLEQVIKQQEKAVQEAAGRVQLFQIANANREFTRHMAEGRLHLADQLAVDFVSKHGRAGLALAPDIAKAFRLTGEGASANPAARLHALGETQHKALRFNPDIGDREEGVTTGLKMLRGIAKRDHLDGYPFRDAAITRSEALAGIDHHPSVRRLQGVSQSISEQLQVLSAQMHTAQKNGDKFHDFIKDAQQRAGKIRELLDSVTEQEKKDLWDVKRAIDTELKEGKITDPTSRRELEKRSKALDDMLRLVDTDYKMPDNSAKIAELRVQLNKVSSGLEDYGSPSNPRRDKILEELRELHAASPRHQVEKLLSKLETPEFKNVSDFNTWLKTEGVVLGAATAGAVLATAAIVFSGGTASPLVLAAAATAAGMVASEFAIEMQYKGGVRSEGSRIGRWSRGEEVTNPDGSVRSMHLGYDVGFSYGAELAAGTLIGWASGGIGAKLGEAFARMTPAAKAAFVAQNKGALDALGRSVARLDLLAAKNTGFAGFMRVLGKEALTQGLFTAGSLLAEKALLEESNRFSSFLVGVGASAMHRGFTARLPQGPVRSGPKGEYLRMEYQSKGPAHEYNYMKSAEKRGSKITMTRDGFVELTKNGLHVDWTRAPGEPGSISGGGNLRRPLVTTETPSKPGSLKIEPVLDPPAGRPTDARTAAGGHATDARRAADARSRDTDGATPPATPPNPHEPSFADLKRKVASEQKLHDLSTREAELTRRRSDPSFRDTDGKVARELAEIAQKKLTVQTEFDGIKLNEGTKKIYDQIKLEHAEATKEAQRAQESLRQTQDAIAREKAAERLRLKGQDEQTILARERAIDESYKTKLQEQESAVLNSSEKVRSVLDKGNALGKFIKATDSYPPGEYMVTGNRDLPAADRAGQPDYEHTGRTRGIKLVIPEGPPIPRKAVDQALENINKLGLRPSEVELVGQLQDLRGDFTQYDSNPFFTRIRVRVGETDHHFLSTHTHETGHLFDLKELYTKGATKTPREIENQWRRTLIDMDKFPDIGDFRRSHKGIEWVAEVLKDPQHPFHGRIKEMGRVAGLDANDYKAHRDLVCDTASKPVFYESPKSKIENSQYWNSRSELLAEMYMLHQQKSAALARGEKPMTYKELVDRFTRPRDQDKAADAPKRADTMMHYEELFKFMEKHMFEPNALRDGAIARFQQQRGPAETGAVRDALRKHGPNSPEFTKALDAARAHSMMRLPEAAVREVFARDHHLDPKFDPKKLPPAQLELYNQYLKVAKPGFNPQSDVPPALREQLASAKAKFDFLEQHMSDFNNRRLEAMRDGLMRDHLRDFLSRQEGNFLNDIHNAWEAGSRKAHAASKSREPYKPFKEPAPDGEVRTPEAYRDWQKARSRMDTINDLYKLHQINMARPDGSKPLTFEQLLQVATAIKMISPEKAKALAHHDALFRHLGRKVIPHMTESTK